jgi:hypothetical protein
MTVVVLAQQPQQAYALLLVYANQQRLLRSHQLCSLSLLNTPCVGCACTLAITHCGIVCTLRWLVIGTLLVELVQST